MKKLLIKILKFILNIIKHIFMLPLYCSMPHKYSGTTYEEWLEKDKRN